MKTTPLKASFILSLLIGCGSVSETISTDICASGTRWIGDDCGDPNMHPGRDCIGCHARTGGPRGFTIGGTVFSELHQDDECFGAPGATIEITDANGGVIVLTSDEAGNFFSDRAFATPYTAKVTVDGVVLKMETPQTNGDCNSCHTSAGANAAPGRIGPDAPGL